MKNSKKVEVYGVKIDAGLTTEQNCIFAAINSFQGQIVPVLEIVNKAIQSRPDFKLNPELSPRTLKNFIYRVTRTLAADASRVLVKESIQSAKFNAQIKAGLKYTFYDATGNQFEVDQTKPKISTQILNSNVAITDVAERVPNYSRFKKPSQAIVRSLAARGFEVDLSKFEN